MLDAAYITALCTGIAAVAGTIGALLVKFWPLLTQSRTERIKAQSDADAGRAKTRMDAHAQVSEEYRDLIDRQQKQMDQQALRIEAVYTDLRAAQGQHAECVTQMERCNGRLAVLEARLERVSTAQAIQDLPTRAEALIVVDESEVITEWNQAATVLFHYRSDEALGMDVKKLIPGRYLPLHEKRWAEVLQTGRPVRRGPFVIEALTKEGATIAVEMTLSGWLDNDGNGTGNHVFSASIRKLPTDARGRVLERGGYRPLPIPEPSAGSVPVGPATSGRDLMPESPALQGGFMEMAGKPRRPDAGAPEPGAPAAGAPAAEAEAPAATVHVSTTPAAGSVVELAPGASVQVSAEAPHAKAGPDAAAPAPAAEAGPAPGEKPCDGCEDEGQK